MSDKTSIDSQEQQLAKLPPELQRLAEWCWHSVRPALSSAMRQLGMTPIVADRNAARIARRVATEVYQELQLERRLEGLKRATGALLFALLLAPIDAAHAQTSGTISLTLGWDQAAPTLAAARQYQYHLILDGVRRTEPMLPVTCTGAVSPFVCSVPILNLSTAAHVFVLIAAELQGGALVESLPSAPLETPVTTAPATPQNLRRLPQPPL